MKKWWYVKKGHLVPETIQKINTPMEAEWILAERDGHAKRMRKVSNWNMTLWVHAFSRQL